MGEAMRGKSESNRSHPTLPELCTHALNETNSYESVYAHPTPKSELGSVAQCPCARTNSPD